MSNSFNNKLVRSENVIIPENDENLIRLYMQNNVGTFTVQTYLGEEFEFYFAKNDPMADGGGGELLANVAKSASRNVSDNAPKFGDFIDHQQNFLPEPRRLIIISGSDAVALEGYEGDGGFVAVSDTLEDGATYEVTQYNPER